MKSRFQLKHIVSPAYLKKSFRKLPRRGRISMLVLAGVALSIILVAIATAPARNQALVPISTVITDVRAGDVARIELHEGSNEVSVFYKDPARGKVTAIKEWQVSVQEALTAGDVPASAMPEIVVERTANAGGLFGFLMLAAIVGPATFLIIRGQGRAGMGGVGKSKARNMAPGDTLPRVTFDDVAGVDEAKQELTEIVEFLKHPEKFSRMGARSPKGVLLVGPPGTGKTLISRAVAGQAGVPFYSISGSEFVEMYVGVGASRVRDLFAVARKTMPCVIFIDEIDAVGRRRSSGHMHVSNEEREQTLNQLLVEMDGFDNQTHIIVVAATNRPDVLDPALLRPGRFDRQVMLDKPDIKGRTAILKVHARGKPLEKGVTLDTIARMTPGFSGADLENLVNEAAILAVRRNKPSVGLHELEEAVDRVLAGPERKSRIISEQEKAITAYHEVGHALTARMLAHVDPVHKVSIIARGMAGGYTRVLPGEDRYLQSRSQFNDYLVFILGGRAAEEVIFDEVTTGASNDLERATDIARGMVMKYGMSQRLGLVSLGRRAGGNFLGGTSDHEVTYSEEVARTIDEEVRNLVNEAYARAIHILTTHKERLVDISELLIERETLDGAEFEALFEGIPRPQPRAARLRKAATTTMPLLSPDMMAAGLAHVPVPVDEERNTPG